jgi:alpha-tubulin suppressor-like RCC1 family protein
VGQNTLGELGLGDNIDRRKPQRIVMEEDIVDIYAGYYFSMVRARNNRMYSFGENRYGQLCAGHINMMYEFPRQVFDCKILESVSLGGQHGLAVTSMHVSHI